MAAESDDRQKLLESEIERRLAERFAALKEEFERIRVETDRRWFGYRDRFDQDLHGVVPGELVAEKAAGRREPGLVSVGAARGLDQAGNQVDVLHRFLDECRSYASRAALLVAKGNTVGAWKAVGYTGRGVDDDVLRHVSAPLPEGGLLARVMTGTALKMSGANEVSSLLRAADAVEAVLIPMVVREKISGVLYADAAPGEEAKFDPTALAFLTFLAGLVVDRLAARKLKPAPALRDPEAFERAKPAGLWMHEAPSVIEVEEPAPALEEVAPERVELDSSAPRLEEKIEVEPALRIPPAPPVVPAAPAGPRRLAGPLAETDLDERHEEARRFARLLVSEIKLYNERAVVEGRDSGNLYERLKEDIDRSRQMYDERIPEDVRSKSNFFYEELVRILADGHPESLGL